jgi:hypothetical protein
MSCAHFRRCTDTRAPPPDEERCDGGTPVSVAVEYPQSGKKKEATVTLTVEGDYPSGYKDTMIKAIQALVPSNGVDYYDVTSYGTQNCAQW